MAYDRGITIFSPDGRIYQVEYAREAVKRGTPSVGVRTRDGVVFVVHLPAQSPLMRTDSIEKLRKIDDHIGIASAGHVADGRQLMDYARRDAQVNRLRYGEPIDTNTLTRHLADVIQQYTQFGGTRPFGVAFIVGGIDNGTPHLYETDPSGMSFEWNAVAVGGNAREIQEYLDSNYSEELDLDGGIRLAVSALSTAVGEPVTSERIRIATIRTDTTQFRELSPTEVSEKLAGMDSDSGSSS